MSETASKQWGIDRLMSTLTEAGHDPDRFDVDLQEGSVKAGGFTEQGYCIEKTGGEVSVTAPSPGGD